LKSRGLNPRAVESILNPGDPNHIEAGSEGSFEDRSYYGELTQASANWATLTISRFGGVESFKRIARTLHRTDESTLLIPPKPLACFSGENPPAVLPLEGECTWQKAKKSYEMQESLYDSACGRSAVQLVCGNQHAINTDIIEVQGKSVAIYLDECSKLLASCRDSRE